MSLRQGGIQLEDNKDQNMDYEQIRYPDTYQVKPPSRNYYRCSNQLTGILFVIGLFICLRKAQFLACSSVCIPSYGLASGPSEHSAKFGFFMLEKLSDFPFCLSDAIWSHFSLWTPRWVGSPWLNKTRRCSIRANKIVDRRVLAHELTISVNPISVAMLHGGVLRMVMVLFYFLALL